MTVVVAATDAQWMELTGSKPDVNWIRVESVSAFADHADVDAYFLLNAKPVAAELNSLHKPVFINAVTETIADLQTASHIYRVNGWATFLGRSVWEVAGKPDETITGILARLQVKAKFVADEPGLVAARVVSMIINEAYLAVEEDVSSKAEIDTAMKLGTNYPFGPFEWAKQIGTVHILNLLERLAADDLRYKPATLLIKEVKKTSL